MRPTQPAAFKDISAFYAARGGARSGEMDFGVWWRSTSAPLTTWRISVVHSTGDVYAEASRGEHVILLGQLNTHDRGERHHPEGDCGGDDCAYGEAERALKSWVEYIHEPDSLTRAQHQVMRASAR